LRSKLVISIIANQVGTFRFKQYYAKRAKLKIKKNKNKIEKTSVETKVFKIIFVDDLKIIW